MVEKELRRALKDAIALIEELDGHLDYCGWGDKWERSCSEDLRNSLQGRLERLKRTAEKQEVPS